MPLRRCLLESRKLAAAGIELDAIGDLAPGNLSQTGRRELRNLLRSHELECAALFCPLRRGIDHPENQEARIDHLRNALTMAWDLEARRVVIQAGKVPADEKDPRWPGYFEALEVLARHGDRVGSTLCLETGLEDGAALRAFLDRIDTGALAACWNPGALLAGGIDPLASARALGDRIVHVHARDARLVSAMGRAQEVPLGQGDIDWFEAAGVLEELDYRGWIVVDGEGIGPQETAAGFGLLRRVFH